MTDLDGERLTEWLLEQQRAGMSAATRNGYRETFVMFANWCCDGVRPRLLKSPFLTVPRAEVRIDRRRQRRAMTEAELTKLLTIAALRPLAEYGRESIPKAGDECSGRSTWRKAPLSLDTIHEAAGRAREQLSKNPDLIAELERRGRERRLIYKTLVLTEPGVGVDVHGPVDMRVPHCRLGGSGCDALLAATALRGVASSVPVARCNSPSEDSSGGRAGSTSSAP